MTARLARFAVILIPASFVIAPDADAQQTGCSVAAQQRTVRPEGLAELIGEISLTCPDATFDGPFLGAIDVSIPNTTVTSRILPQGIETEAIGSPAGQHALLKAIAVGQYRSQLRALSSEGRPGYADAFEPERYWRLRFRSPTSHGSSRWL